MALTLMEHAMMDGTQIGPVLSPVDYDAWRKGYMPPSEHILIDRLSYRGAKVVLSTALSREHQMWLVIDGPPLNRATRKRLLEFTAIWFGDDDDESSPQAPGATTDEIGGKESCAKLLRTEAERLLIAGAWEKGNELKSAADFLAPPSPTSDR